MASNKKQTDQIDLILRDDKISYFGAGNPLQEDLVCDYRFCGCRRTRFIWVSHQLRAIYFGVPKAASSSIRHVLGVAGAHAFLESSTRAIMRHGGVDKLNFSLDPNQSSLTKGQTVKKWLKPSLKSQIISEVKKQGKLMSEYVHIVDSSSYSSNFEFKLLDLSPAQAIEEYPDYLSFTFVRNPWGRVASSYKMFIKSKQERYKKFSETMFGSDYSKLSFSQFVSKLETAKNCHWNQAINFLPVGKDGKIKLDFIGKVENIGSDWGYVSGKLGLPSKLPRLKKSPTSYTIKWDKKSLGIIDRLFKEDLKAFNYKTSKINKG